MVYNESTGKFVAVGFFGVTTFAREVDAVTKGVSAVIPVAANPSTPLAAAARPNAVDPQVVIMTKRINGLDGVHAHIVHLPPPPPSFSDTKMSDSFLQVAYSQKVPVVGGTAPLTYQVIGGSLPPGLSGPDGNGFINGTPNQISPIGTPFNFNLKVTDGDGREVTGALNHSIKLGAPTSVAPASGFVTNNAMPTFSWNAPPSAGVFTYNLQADNNTTGATNVVNQVGLSGTSFTPSSAIADGMIGTCQQLWDTRELHLMGETREVGAIDVNIDQDLVA